MEWVALEEVAAGSARLVALKLATGERRGLYHSNHAFPLRASLHPRGIRIAVDAVSKSPLRGDVRARVGVVNLESGGIGWLRQSLDPKWRIGGAVFDDSGARLALEGAYGGAPLPDLYVYQVGFHGNSIRDKIVAGAGSKDRLGIRRPLFLPGGEQVVFLRNTRADGAWEVCLLDLTHTGDSAVSLEGRAPSALTLTLTDGAQAQPENGLCYCEPLRRVFFVGRTRPRGRQQIRWAALDGGGWQALSQEFLRVEDMCVAPGGELIAFAADGQLWLADVETGASVPLIGGDASSTHRGLTFDLDAGQLLFCTTDESGGYVRRLHLESRLIEDMYDLGHNVTVIGMTALPTTPLLEKLPVEDDAAAWKPGASAPGKYPWATEISSTSPSMVTEVQDTRAESTTGTDVHDLAPDHTDDSATDATDVTADNTVEDLAGADSADGSGSGDTARTQVTDAPVGEPRPLAVPGRVAAHSIGTTPAPFETRVDETEPHFAPIPEAVLTSTPPQSDPAGSWSSPSESTDSGAIGADSEAVWRASIPPRASDFGVWMSRLGEDIDPAMPLRSLERMRGDPMLSDIAAQWLDAQIARTEAEPEAVTDLVFAIGASAHLGNQRAAPSLEHLCRRMRDRLAEADALPEVEEHFALAALRHIRGIASEFRFAEVYDHYETILAQTANALHRGGDAAAQELMQSFAGLYRAMLSETVPEAEAAPLAAPAPMTVGRANDAVAIARPVASPVTTAPDSAPIPMAEAVRVAMMAGIGPDLERVAPFSPAAPTADPISTAEIAPVAEPIRADEIAPATAEMDRPIREVPYAPAASPEALRPAPQLAQAAPDSSHGEASEQARTADHGPEIAAPQAAVPLSMSPFHEGDEERVRNRVAAAEETEWARLRAAAEGHGAPVAEIRLPEDEDVEWEQLRAVAERDNGAGEDEEAEWARRRAAAAPPENHRQLIGQPVAPQVDPALSPRIGSSRPTPVQRSSRARFPNRSSDGWRPFEQGRSLYPTPKPRRRITDAFTGSHSTASLSIEAAGVAPRAVSTTAVVAAVAGVAQILVGTVLGAALIAMGAAGLVAGAGLLGERRWGWLTALVALPVNAAVLIYYAFGTLPMWVPAPALLAGAAVAIGLEIALLQPRIRTRFDPRRRRF